MESKCLWMILERDIRPFLSEKASIDTLKIDKSFIDTITMDENTRVIADSVVNMAKRLGYETIAEGVEDQDQFNYLKKIGCDCIQGFFLEDHLLLKKLNVYCSGLRRVRGNTECF